VGQRPQAFQESLEQRRMDRLNQGMTPPMPLGMHLADATEQENRRRRRSGSRGLNYRPGATTTLPTVPEQGEGLQPVFDNGNQQNMLEYLNTTSAQDFAATVPPLDMATFPNVPEGLQEFTFDSADFPSFPEFINNGAPTSPANANTFIDDYLNTSTPIHEGTPPMLSFSSQQNLLEFQQDTEAETSAERQRASADQTELDREEMHDMNQPITGPRFSEPYKPAKPSSPPRKRIEANRMIAPDTPGEPARRSTHIERNEQTPDVDEVPTKGPLRVRKDTIAAKKKKRLIQSPPPTRRSRPPPGALKETPVSSTPPRSESEPSEETESDTPRRARRRSKPGNAVSSESSEGSDQPSDRRDKTGTGRVGSIVNQFEYKKIWDAAPDKSRIPASARPANVGSKTSFERYLAQKRKETNTPNRLRNETAQANMPHKRDLAQRTGELNRLYNEAAKRGDPNSVKPQRFIDSFYENPDNFHIPLERSAVVRFKREKRKERQKANNPNTDPKEQTKKKKKK